MEYKNSKTPSHYKNPSSYTAFTTFNHPLLESPISFNFNKTQTFNKKTKTNNIHLPLNETKYLENKFALANIFDQTKYLLNSSIEKGKQLNRLKLFQKTKYLTSMKSLQLLQEMEYNKKWKLDQNQSEEAGPIVVHDKFHTQKKKRSTMKLLPQVKLSLKNILSPINKTKDNLEETHAINANVKTEFETLPVYDTIEKELELKMANEEPKYEKKRICNDKSDLRNLSSLHFVNFKETNQIRRAKGGSMSNAESVISKSDHKYYSKSRFINYEEKMKENIHSYIDYAAKVGLANNDYDYISNVDKGLSMKNEIKNMNAGLLPPGNLINFNENCNFKKIKMVQPVFIKTKFKKNIAINETMRPKLIKLKKIKSEIN